MKLVSLFSFLYLYVTVVSFADERYSLVVSTPDCDPGYDCVGTQIVGPNVTSDTITRIDCTGFGGYFCDENGAISLCKSGRYCPTHLETYTCPEGKWCPNGATHPFDCFPLSSCPEGSFKMRWFLLTVLFFLVFGSTIATYKLYRKKKNEEAELFLQQRKLAAEAEMNCAVASLEMQSIHHTTPSKESKPTTKMNVTTIRPVSPPHVRQQQDNNDSVQTSSSSLPSLVLDFQHLTVKSNHKVVIDNISGQLRSGRLTAIMGGSSSIKTTFLRALLGRHPIAATSSVTVNAHHSIHELSTQIGFVPPENIMLTMLTVRQLLVHSACTRLPHTMSLADKLDLVQHAMQILNITHIADVVIGDDVNRGISGGERKRVSIAMELVADPLILFLDEATSGLDASAAMDVVDGLRQIADKGTIVAAVIHQPRYEVFSLFDDILLFGEHGGLIYFGPVHDIAAFFAHMNYIPRAFTNPADFYLDTISSPYFQATWEKGGVAAFQQDKQPQAQMTHPAIHNSNQPSQSQSQKEADTHERKNTASLPEQPVICFHEEEEEELASGETASLHELQIVKPTNTATAATISPAEPIVRIHLDAVTYAQECGPLDQSTVSGTSSKQHLSLQPPAAFPASAETTSSTTLSTTTTPPVVVSDRLPLRTSASWWSQVYYLLLRHFYVDVGCATALLFDTVIQIIPGASLAIPTLDQDPYVPPLPRSIAEQCPGIIRARCLELAVDDSYVTFPTFFICMIVGVASALWAVRTFGKHMSVFFRDRDGGQSTSAYWVSKILYDLLHVTRCALIFLSFYFILSSPRGSFWEWLAVIWTLYFATFGVSYFISVLVSFRNSTTINVVLAIVFSVTSGLNPKLDTVKGWGPLYAIWTLSYNRWGAEAIIILNEKGQPNQRVAETMSNSGYEIDNFALDIGATVLIGLMWRVFALILLARKKH